MNNCFAKSVALCVVIFSLIFTVSCSLNENGKMHTVSEVDFSQPVKVQIEYNEQVTDTVIKYDGINLELNYDNAKEAIGGAFVKISPQRYKITYTDLIFEGENSQLPDSFLPKIIYTFFKDNGNVLTAESYEETKGCYSGSFSVGTSFLKAEVYESENGKSVLFLIK